MRPGRRASLVVAALLLAACATTRLVPASAPGVSADPAAAAATVEAAGVQVTVRASAWQGSPSILPAYVTPFHVLVVNGTGAPLEWQYADLRLFDDSRFQYTALPPAEVERILRAAGVEADPVRLAAAMEAESRPVAYRRFGPPPFFWDPWWWDPYPPLYYAPWPLDDVFLQALSVGALQPGARTEGFAYFPRLRPQAGRVTFEFHYRQGAAERVLVLPFEVRRG